MKSKCNCKKPKPYYRKYVFKDRYTGYKSTCKGCGLLIGWYDGKNYKIVTGNSLGKKKRR